MKKLMVVAVSLCILFGSQAYSQTHENGVIESILSSYSPRTFTAVPVTDNQIDQIVQCGIKAPSARNGQPWKFTVVKNAELCRAMIQNINEGNVVIVVSGAEDSQNVDFDCALATQNMFTAACGLGLGARIYTGPVSNINSTMRKSLEIPEGYRVVAILRVGNVDPKADAVTAASARKDAKEIVNTR